MVVDSSSSGAWPWSWYLRDLDAAYVDLAVDPAAAADAWRRLQDWFAAHLG